MPCMNRASIVVLWACYEELVPAPSDFRNRFPQEIPSGLDSRSSWGTNAGAKNTGPGGVSVTYCIVFQILEFATGLPVEAAAPSLETRLAAAFPVASANFPKTRLQRSDRVKTRHPPFHPISTPFPGRFQLLCGLCDALVPFAGRAFNRKARRRSRHGKRRKRRLVTSRSQRQATIVFC